MATNNATATKTPAPETTPTPCKFAGLPGLCAADTLSNKTIQIGSPDQPGGVAYINTCGACADRLGEQHRVERDKKFHGELPRGTLVRDVIICNQAKVDFLAHAASHNGEGLVARKIKTSRGELPVCSCLHWNGAPCSMPTKNMGVAFGGVVYDFCGPCAVAAKLVAIRDKQPMMSPILIRDAEKRARRQLDEAAERRRKEETKAKSHQAPAVVPNTAISVFEEILFATSPVRAPTAADLKVTRHLGE